MRGGPVLFEGRRDFQDHARLMGSVSVISRPLTRRPATPGLRVRSHPLLGAVPAPGASHRLQAALLGSPAERQGCQARPCQRRERQDPQRPGECRQEEPVEAVLDSPGDQLRERSVLAAVAALQRLEVPGSVALVDDGGRVASPDEHEVEDQASGAAFAVAEGMDALECCVEVGQVFHEVNDFGRLVVGEAKPVRDRRMGRP